MGVRVNNYVLLGTKIPYEGDGQYERFKKWMDSAFEPKKKGIVCLFDGMSGEYVFLGEVIASTDEDNPVFNEPICLDIPKKRKDAVVKQLTKLFGLKRPKVQTWIVSHHG